MSQFLVISTSLNPDSNSRSLARAAFDALSKSHSAEWIDLRDLNLPLCDGAAAYSHPSVGPLTERISDAGCVLMAIPVYNYAASAAAKNLVELTGRAWSEKVVGFLCAAGGRMSYMAVMNIANSLMLDFRCLIIPRFVYADEASFNGDKHPSEIQDRIEELVSAAVRLTNAIQKSR